MSHPFNLPIRMAVAEKPRMTESEVLLVAGLMEGWAEVAQLTEETSGLTEFGRVVEMLLGDDNWQRIKERSPKFQSVENGSDDHGGPKVVDPKIATMSLTGRFDELLVSGRCTRDEYTRFSSNPSEPAAAGFLEAREACPPDICEGGADAAADSILGVDSVLGADAGADFVFGRD